MQARTNFDFRFVISDAFPQLFLRSTYTRDEKVGKSWQPWLIFQFPFFFGQIDNKESKNKYSSIAV